MVGFFSNVFMIGVGGFFMLSGAMHGGIRPGGFTPGKLVAFRAYWWRLFGPIQTLARVNDMVQRAGAAGRRVFEVLDAPDELPDAPDADPVERVRGEMELRDVSLPLRPTSISRRPSRRASGRSASRRADRAART